MATYKIEHESFVSNGVGTGAINILACLLHAPPLVYVLLSWQAGRQPSVIRDLFVISLPALLSLTLLAEYQLYTLVISYALAGVVYLSSYSSLPIEDFRGQAESHQKSFLTLFKGLNVLMTCVAILAVDFTVFPRNFGKTETFGTSVMDIGVGTFIVSSALTSRFARTEDNKEVAASVRLRKLFTLQKVVVLMLGFGRFVLLKAVNYHEHVSEYGIHWNFFMTLYFIWTTADLVHALVPRALIVWLAVALLGTYQLVLCNTELTTYLFSDYREDVISANKEGIFSLCGYIPLYLVAEAVSHQLFFQTSSGAGFISARKCKESDDESTSTTRRKGSEQPEDEGISPGGAAGNEATPGRTGTTAATLAANLDKQLIRNLLLYSVATWLLWFASSRLVQDTSRRLANFPYVCLVLALALSTIFMLFLADTLGASRHPVVHTNNSNHLGVLTLHYMNKHSLMVFLVANVITGMVNMTTQTIHASPQVAFAILSAYTTTITCVAWGIEYASTWYKKSYLKPTKQ